MEYQYPKDEKQDSDSIYVVSALSFAKQWTVFGTYSHEEIVKEIASLLFQMFGITEDDGVLFIVQTVSSVFLYMDNNSRNSCSYSVSVMSEFILSQYAVRLKYWYVSDNGR